MVSHAASVLRCHTILVLKLATCTAPATARTTIKLPVSAKVPLSAHARFMLPSFFGRRCDNGLIFAAARCAVFVFYLLSNVRFQDLRL
jgi:hypothetical protein